MMYLLRDTVAAAPITIPAPRKEQRCIVAMWEIGGWLIERTRAQGGFESSADFATAMKEINRMVECPCVSGGECHADYGLAAEVTPLYGDFGPEAA